MTTTPPFDPRQPARHSAREPELVRDLPEQRGPRVRHQPRSVRRDFYRYRASVTHHPQGETSKLGIQDFSNPKNPCRAGRSRAPLTNSTTAPVSPPTPRQAIIYGQNVLASRGFTGQPPWKGEASRAVGGRASRSCRRLLVGSDPSAELTISDIRCAWDNPRTASARATILRSATGWLRCSDLANSRVALVDVGVRPPGSSLLADAATPVTPLLPM